MEKSDNCASNKPLRGIMNDAELQVYEFTRPEYLLIKRVWDHAHLGIFAAAELECILGGSIKDFTGKLAPGQVSLIRDLAKELNVKLPC